MIFVLVLLTQADVAYFPRTDTTGIDNSVGALYEVDHNVCVWCEDVKHAKQGMFIPARRDMVQIYGTWARVPVETKPAWLDWSRTTRTDCPKRRE